MEQTGLTGVRKKLKKREKRIPVDNLVAMQIVEAQSDFSNPKEDSLLRD
jgi:hypothetical protein